MIKILKKTIKNRMKINKLRLLIMNAQKANLIVMSLSNKMKN